MKQILSAEEIHSGITRLAAQIREEFAGRSITVIGVLTGSIVFLADLIRQLDLPMRVGVVQARSYRGEQTRPGELTIHAEFLPPVTGEHVLLVDDIFDTGRTLEHLMARFREMRPESLSAAVLLRKAGRAETKFVPQFIGFEIPDDFVVGYGLDFNDRYRNLPYIAVLEGRELHGGSRT